MLAKPNPESLLAPLLNYNDLHVEYILLMDIVIYLFISIFLGNQNVNHSLSNLNQSNFTLNRPNFKFFNTLYHWTEIRASFSFRSKNGSRNDTVRRVLGFFFFLLARHAFTIFPAIGRRTSFPVLRNSPQWFCDRSSKTPAAPTFRSFAWFHPMKLAFSRFPFRAGDLKFR